MSTYSENAIFLEELQSQRETISILEKANDILLKSRPQKPINSQDVQAPSTPQPASPSAASVYMTPTSKSSRMPIMIRNVLEDRDPITEADSFTLNKTVSLIVDLLLLYQQLVDEMYRNLALKQQELDAEKAKAPITDNSADVASLRTTEANRTQESPRDPRHYRLFPLYILTIICIYLLIYSIVYMKWTQDAYDIPY
jgi:hypothetical protein